MATVQEPACDTTVSASVDVLVVGAGSAGVAAAVAASEEGAETLLAEASAAVGGTLAHQLLESSCGFHTTGGQQIVGGVGQRIIDHLQSYGGTPGHVSDDTRYTSMRVPVNHAELALAEAELLAKAGAQLVLTTTAVRVFKDGDCITHVVFDGKNGRHAVRARHVIDTTGDADVAFLAGTPFQTDSSDAMQPASLLFKLGGIDFEQLLAYAREQPSDFREGSHFPDTSVSNVHLWGFGDLLKRAHKAGSLELQRRELHLSGWPSRHEAVVNATRVRASNSSREWSGNALSILSRQALELVRFFRDYVPGCDSAYIVAIGSQVGIRESRRICGRYTLTEHDLKSGRRFPDAIAQGGFPIDIHDAAGESLSHTAVLNGAFDIPYRCLLPDGATNILVGGRSISSTHVANGSVRQTAQCFATGEAAGVAAAMASASNTLLPNLSTTELRASLLNRGVLLSPPS